MSKDYTLFPTGPQYELAVYEPGCSANRWDLLCPTDKPIVVYTDDKPVHDVILVSFGTGNPDLTRAEYRSTVSTCYHTEQECYYVGLFVDKADREFQDRIMHHSANLPLKSFDGDKRTANNGYVLCVSSATVALFATGDGLLILSDSAKERYSALQAY